jgi:hypothetical protein
MDVEHGEGDVFTFFEENLNTVETDGTEYYTPMRDDGIEVCAYVFEGPGLWGATSSSNAVLKIINDFAPEILKEYGRVGR